MLAAVVLTVAAIVAGCGTSPVPSASPSTHPSETVSPTVSGSPDAPGSNALTGEAESAAAGDIPDNQVFLVFHDGPADYAMKYPEGWAQKGTGGNVTFRDKNNIVRIVVADGAPPTIATVKDQLAQLKASSTSFSAGQPATMTIGGAPAIKVTYQTESAPNPVTGQRVNLVVDRYYLARNSKVAVVDLGTPQGVNNVDAYRLMIESFRWK